MMPNLKKLFQRQLDLVNPSELDFPITVIGAGGIGSWATLSLAKMGCSRLTVVDFDSVSSHNIPSQFYSLDQVKKRKVEALADNIKQFSHTTIIPVDKRYEEWYMHDDGVIVICCVDSISARKEIFDCVLMNRFGNRFPPVKFLDLRMGGELLRILPVNLFNSRDIVKYLKTLQGMEHEEPCSARAISYNTLLAGGIAASLVKRYVKREEVKRQYIFDVATTSIV